jgi:glycosyltransferase involved in cell wall biosynthesis
MNNPLISVIVPCFNQASYLPEALTSVMAQTYTNWECIIVNDGSPDDTHKVAQEWLEKDARFKYVKKVNGGLSSARNVGIKSSDGTFILPLDADDKISDDYLELALKLFIQDSKLKVVYCKAEKFGAETGEWLLQNFSRKALALDNMIFCAAIYRKSEWKRVGGYDVKMVYGLEDWEFWIAILKNGGTVKKLDSVCFYYRVKEVSMIKSLHNDAVKQQLKYEYLSFKHIDFFLAELGSFIALGNKVRQLEKNDYRTITDKKKAIKIFLKVFFGINYFNE